MRRTTPPTAPLTTAGLLGLALLAPVAWASPAAAAAETCRGEMATIVGTGPTVTGTEGRDVIVTGSATSVDALGGDDLICVAIIGSPNANVLDVDAGTGADVVDTTAMGGGYYVATTLGAGTDTFVGGRTGDTVWAGDGSWDGAGTDTEIDQIDTGTGRDSVLSGTPGTANHDVVRLGDGDDDLTLGSPALAADALVDGGAGEDGLTLRTQDDDVTLDVPSSTFTSAAGTAAFSGFERSSIVAGSGTVTYRGTDGDDTFDVHPQGGTPTLRVTTGAGDDGVTVEPATITAASSIDTGAGDDKVVAATQTGSLAIDLPRDVLTVAGAEVPAVGVEDAWLLAPTVAMTGDGQDNELTWSGCDATLRGGEGDDSLAWNYDYLFEAYEFDCAGGKATMNGGDGGDYLRPAGGDDRLVGGRGHDKIFGRGGDDTIRGSAGNDTLDGGEGRDDVRGQQGRDKLLGRGGGDTLLGGPGRDTVDGANGRDRCAAERERRCER
ncbi:calcium-binding protein [uncultured Nocardioides sp.]|uniref:calcium-binding protein n=1 Tax=uncultured Nocardioides sp. TaxID=198441 RepID=UPI002616A985|nr:calcium-binding protein [uncultured Nocardioides sp.]